MKECDLYCTKCKNIRHLAKDCTYNKNVHLAIHIIYFKNIIKVLFTLNLLIKIEIMLMSLTMSYQVLAQKGYPFGCQRHW
jgi:hypothetical protein